MNWKWKEREVVIGIEIEEGIEVEIGGVIEVAVEIEKGIEEIEAKVVVAGSKRKGIEVEDTSN